jgi:disulfide bond formation protein DsbB
VLILCGVLLGALWVQFVWQERPCPLCLLQRIGMIGVAGAGLLNLRFGARMSHYGLALFSALSGGTVALLQTAVLALRSESYGSPVFGLHLYTWSVLVFASVLIGLGLLLLLGPFPNGQRRFSGRLTFRLLGGLLLAITVINGLATAWQCGVGLCWG